MTTAEAKEMIKKEFMESYREWLKDEREMPDGEYGRKYGWGKSPVGPHKDCFDSVKVFMEYVFAGRYLPGWVRQGYDKETIWALYREGFLSYKNYSNWNARMRGQEDWFFITQKTARMIYKEAKAA